MNSEMIIDLIDLAAYMPIEISREMLILSIQHLMVSYPKLRIIPTCADFTGPLELPVVDDPGVARKVVFFPGSTIGNFHPTDAVRFLKHFSQLVGPGPTYLYTVL